jgi:hypothetical protein
MNLLKETHYRGNLYHATSRLNSILESGGLLSHSADYISLSRSPEILSSIGSKPYILVFDGEKLNYRFRIKPFIDTGFVERHYAEA